MLRVIKIELLLYNKNDMMKLTQPTEKNNISGVTI